MLSEIRLAREPSDVFSSRWNSRIFWIIWEMIPMAIRKAQVEDMLPHWLYSVRYVYAVMREGVGLKGEPDPTNPVEVELMKKAADVALAITGKVKF